MFAQGDSVSLLWLSFQHAVREFHLFIIDDCEENLKSEEIRILKIETDGSLRYNKLDRQWVIRTGVHSSS